MDLGGFFGGISNFLGGLFDPNKNKQQRQAPAPAPQPQPQSQAPRVGIQMPQGLTIPVASAQTQNQAPSIVGGVNKPAQPQGNFFTDAAKNVGDFTAQANDALYGGLTRGGANIVNSFADGFNPDETAKRTSDFMKSIGQNSNQDGQSNLALGTDKNSTAGRIGQAVGGTEKVVADTAPFLAMPGVAAIDALPLAGKVGINTGIGAGAGFGQGMANGGSIGDDAATAALGGIIGGGATATASLLPKLLSPLVSRFVNKNASDESIVGTSLADDLAGTANKSEPTAKPSEPSPTAPSDPITTSPTTNKAPAITSGNPDFVPPVKAQAPAPIQLPPTASNPAPEIGGIPPVRTAPVEVPTASAPVQQAEAQIAKAQDAVAKDAVKPAPAPAESKAVRTQSPATAKEQALAEAQTPPPQATREALPTTPKTEVPKPEPAPVETGNRASSLDDKPFGTIANEATKANPNGFTTDATSKELGDYLQGRSEAEANKLGVNPDSVLKKVQSASRDKTNPTFKEIGLNDNEQKWYSGYRNELDTIRERGTLGNTTGEQKFYSPQQTTDTVYDPSLVNEGRRTDAIPLKELDYTHQPFNDYVRRYSNASKSMTDNIVDSIENVPDPKAPEGFRKTGIEVPDDVKASIQKQADDFVSKFDARSAAGDSKAFKNLDKEVSDQADAVTVKALDYLKTQPKTAATDQVIAELSKGSGSYVHTYIESNMLGQVGGRVADQINGAIVKIVDKSTLGIATRLTENLTGVKLAPRTSLGRQVAKDWSRGTTFSEVKQGFNTNRRILSAQARTPVGKVLATTRAGTTGLVQAADLGTQNASKSVGYFVREAEDAGINTRKGMDEFIARKMSTGEYDKVKGATSSVNNQNVSLSTNPDHSNVQSDNLWLHSLGKWVDSVPKTIVAKNPNLNPLAKKALTSGITRFITGFAKVTGTAASRGIDVATGGLPTYVRGFKALQTAETAAERVAAAQTVRQGMIDTIAGGGFTALGVAMGQNGMYVGNYPSDPKERARWASEGIQPNTLRIPSGKDKDGTQQYTYVQLGRLGPYALPMVIGASIASGNTSNPLSTISDISSQFVQNFGLDQTGNLFKTAGTAITGDWPTVAKNLKQIGTSMVDGIIPASGALNELGNATDRLKRDTSGLIEGLQAKLPGVRNNLAPKTDAYGMPVQNGNIGLGSWLTVGKTPNDPLYQEIDRLHSQSSIEAEPSNTAINVNGLDGKAIKLTSDQQKSLTQTVQQEKQHQAEVLIKTPEYQQADDATKADMLSKAYALDSSGTANDWAKQNGISNVKTNGKLINNNLSDADQSALVTYATLGSDKGKVWLEDNGNNLSYVQATVNNKTANKTLTTEDQSMDKKGSLAQQLAIAHVNKDNSLTQDTINNYANTKISDFNQMIKDGDPTADDLITYDKELVAAGLPSKFENKNGGYGSTAGVRGGASKSFVSAQLPSSLVGTGTKNGASQYAAVAPLFKPIASVSTPAPTAIPKGRTISFKKGL